MKQRGGLFDLTLAVLAAALAVVAIVSWTQHRHLEAHLKDLELDRGRLNAELASRKREASNKGRLLAKNLASNDVSRYPQKIIDAIRRLEDPRFANLGRARVDSNYTPLFRKLKLPDEKLEYLKELLAQRLRVVPEALQLAGGEDLALDELPDRKEILAAGMEEIDAAIADELGADDYATFQAFQASMNGRRYMVQPFADHLSSGSSSLSDSQIDALATAASEADFGTNEIILRPPGPTIPASLDLAAANVLNPDQQRAYQEYKDVWSAKRLKAQLDLALYIQNQSTAAKGNAP